MSWSTIIGRRYVTAVKNTPDPDVAVAASHRPRYWRQQAGPCRADQGNSGHVFRDRHRASSTRRMGWSRRDGPDSAEKCVINPSHFGTSQ